MNDVAGVTNPWLTSSMSLAPVAADEVSCGSPMQHEDTESIEEVTKHAVRLALRKAFLFSTHSLFILL